MPLMTITSLFATIILLGFLQAPSAYQLSAPRFRDRLQSVERENLWPYWVDDPDDRQEVISDGTEKKSLPTLPLLPPYLERLKKFQSLKDKEKYVAALNSYYMIFGRPRFG